MLGDETARADDMNENAAFDAPTPKRRKKRIKKVIDNEGGSKEPFDHILKYNLEGGEIEAGNENTPFLTGSLAKEIVEEE